MKSLNIKADNCILKVGSISDVYIDDIPVSKLLHDNLPEMEKYKAYNAEVHISIKIVENGMQIYKGGYGKKIEQEDREQAENTVTEDDTNG